MLSELQSIARVVTPYALDIYDRSAANALLPQLAATIPNPTKAKSVTLEWTTIFTQLHKWVGERVVQKSFATPIPGATAFVVNDNTVSAAPTANNIPAGKFTRPYSASAWFVDLERR